MFSVIQVLGEGAYGKVYKVRCLKSFVINSDGKVLTPTMKMRKKLTKNLGYTKTYNSSSQRRELTVD